MVILPKRKIAIVKAKVGFTVACVVIKNNFMMANRS
jgi:hypothetical protein